MGHWGGDNYADYYMMYFSIPQALSMGLSGIPFFVWMHVGSMVTLIWSYVLDGCNWLHSSHSTETTMFWVLFHKSHMFGKLL